MSFSNEDPCLAQCLVGDAEALRSSLSVSTSRRAAARSVRHLAAAVLGGSGACLDQLSRFYSPSSPLEPNPPPSRGGIDGRGGSDRHGSPYAADSSKAGSPKGAVRSPAGARDPGARNADHLGTRSARRLLSAVVMRWAIKGAMPPVVENVSSWAISERDAAARVDAAALAASPAAKRRSSDRPAHRSPAAGAAGTGDGGAAARAGQPGEWPTAATDERTARIAPNETDPADAETRLLGPSWPRDDGDGACSWQGLMNHELGLPQELRDQMRRPPRRRGSVREGAGAAGARAEGGADNDARDAHGEDEDPPRALPKPVEATSLMSVFPVPDVARVSFLGGALGGHTDGDAAGSAAPAGVAAFVPIVDFLARAPAALYPLHLACALGCDDAAEWLVRDLRLDPSEPITVRPGGIREDPSLGSTSPGPGAAADGSAERTGRDEGVAELKRPLAQVVDVPLIDAGAAAADGGVGGADAVDRPRPAAAAPVPMWRRHHPCDAVTALHVACSAGNDACVEVLSGAGADDRAKTSRGLVPWDHAALQGHTDCAGMVLDRPAAISLTLSGSTDALGRLLRAGVAKPEDNDEGGFTLLHHAAWAGHVPTAAAVLRAMGIPDGALEAALAGSRGTRAENGIVGNGGVGSDESSGRGDGQDADAVGGGDGSGGAEKGGGGEPGVASTTTAVPEDVLTSLNRIDNDDGRSPLDIAARRGHLGVVLLLLRLGADVTVLNRSGRTPLHGGAHEGHTLVCRALLAHGAPPSAADPRGTTPLHMAASRGHEGCAVALLTGGARWDAPSRSGAIPFDIALAKGRDGVARLLGGYPVLRSLIVSCDVERFRGMVDRGADPTVTGVDGSTLLHDAVESGYLDATLALLALPGPRDLVSEANLAGDTPLHIAAAVGALPIARALLDAGADRNKRSVPHRRRADGGEGGVPRAMGDGVGEIVDQDVGGNVDGDGDGDGEAAGNSRALEEKISDSRHPLPYEVAEAAGHAECAALLFPVGPLFRACRDGDLEAIQEILASEEEETRDGDTSRDAVEDASGGAAAASAAASAAAGPRRDPNVDAMGRTVMHMACEAHALGRVDGREAAEEAGHRGSADPSAAGPTLSIPALLSTRGRGRFALLFEADRDGDTPLDLFAAHRAEAATARGAEDGSESVSDSDSNNGNGNGNGTAEAATAGRLSWASQLLRLGAALCDDDDQFSSILAVIATDEADGGPRAAAAALASSDRFGLGPLHHAAASLHLPVVRRLLRLGASPAAVSKGGRTPLHECLLPSAVLTGPSVYARGTMLRLRKARQQDALAVARELLEAARDANALSSAADAMLDTPLHLAAVAGSAPTVRLLLDSGADPFVTDVEDRLPLVRCPAEAKLARRLLEEAMSRGAARVYTRRALADIGVAAGADDDESGSTYGVEEGTGDEGSGDSQGHGSATEEDGVTRGSSDDGGASRGSGTAEVEPGRDGVGAARTPVSGRRHRSSPPPLFTPSPPPVPRGEGASPMKQPQWATRQRPSPSSRADPYASIARPRHGASTPPRAPEIPSSDSEPMALSRTGSLGTLRSNSAGSKRDLLRGIVDDDPSASLAMDHAAPRDLPPVKPGAVGTPSPSRGKGKARPPPRLAGGHRPDWDARIIAEPPIKRYPAPPTQTRATHQRQR